MLTLENKRWLFEVFSPICPAPTPALPPAPRPPAQTLEDFPNGPGTILAKMLSRVGIKSTPKCSCLRRAMEMNTRGAEWCSRNIDTVVGWLREESEKRKIPYVDLAGRMLVQRAIRLSRKASK